ncbi:hypothetical protein DLM78_14750 [Leptospira stimsonii]|uniref:Uncharacterized protein n=1 Tax=Leptospira stimsonii TaxID=2202203 RepID=A0A8B3CNP8_9LEPT|nr:hypothetical protein DLM78_14750 [Leptospira stimsonii]
MNLKTKDGDNSSFLKKKLRSLWGAEFVRIHFDHSTVSLSIFSKKNPLLQTETNQKNNLLKTDNLPSA